MGKFYAFTGETKKHNGRVLRRIVKLNGCLVGGWIESEDNLPNEEINSDAFVYGESMVFGESKILNSQIYDNAIIFNSVVRDSVVRKRSYVRDTFVKDSEIINSEIVQSDIKISLIKDKCTIVESFILDTIIEERLSILNSMLEYIDSFNSHVSGGIYTYCPSDFEHLTLIIPSPGSNICNTRPATYFKDGDGDIRVNIGCQRNITIGELVERIGDISSEDNRHREIYLKQIEIVKKCL